MAVGIPEILKEHEINMREYITVTLDYQGNPDQLFYTGTLIYDSAPVAVMNFDFLTFKFRMIDKFDNFTGSNKIYLRTTIYDPKFILPSQNQMEFIMNIPPQNCKNILEKSEARALD